ncbi:MAG: 3-isopropylmalate dehydratase large subunit [Clostridia bacterium]|nr:3-isopropylmalate dehydratase large subunit [Clostridia bacterium]
MSMTMSQKILAFHAGLDFVKPGQLVMAKLDMTLANDITAPVSIEQFEKTGADRVFNRDKIALVLDHFAPCKDIKSAQLCRRVRDFANKYEITNFFDVGRAGIEHALLPEQGLVCAGDLVIGADSHTCTYGALGAFSTGVGSTDLAAAMVTGQSWFKVPDAIKVVLKGSCKPPVSGKDVILHLIGLLGVDGALYKSLEFCGEGVGSLSMDDRFCICNMAIEAGAKNGIFPVDEKTLEFCSSHGHRKPVVYAADEDARYCQEIVIDLSELKQTVALPHLPENTVELDSMSPVKIDQVVIGSCTNGYLSDLRAAAGILNGKRIADSVRCLIFPATRKIYLDALHEGLIDIFINAGAAVSTPTCGPCLGGHMGVLAKGERCVSTTNRNFVGRMGEVGSEVYLASAATAAECALTGYCGRGTD